MSAPVIAGLVFTLLGVYMLRHSLASLKEAEQSIKWPSVRGRITKCNVSQPRATSNHRILYVEYEYCVREKEYLGTRDALYTLRGDEVLTLERQYKESPDVNVYYDPTTPERSTLVVGAREGKKYSDTILASIGIIVGVCLGTSEQAAQIALNT